MYSFHYRDVLNLGPIGLYSTEVNSSIHVLQISDADGERVWMLIIRDRKVVLAVFGSRLSINNPIDWVTLQFVKVLPFILMLLCIVTADGDILFQVPSHRHWLHTTRICQSTKRSFGTAWSGGMAWLYIFILLAKHPHHLGLSDSFPDATYNFLQISISQHPAGSALWWTLWWRTLLFSYTLKSFPHEQRHSECKSNSYCYSQILLTCKFVLREMSHASLWWPQ